MGGSVVDANAAAFAASVAVMAVDYDAVIAATIVDAAATDEWGEDA